MKLRLLILFLLLGLLPARGLDIVTATVSVTNAAGTTNGQTITVNASVRTWTNSVFVPATQILTNNTPEGAATNLFLHVATTPFSGLSLNRTTSTNITLQTAPGGTITVTLSDGWGTVNYSTQSLTTAWVVRVPPTVETAAVRTNVASGLALWLSNSAGTNAIDQNARAVSELVGLTNVQTIGGVKTFTNQSAIWYGIVSNSPAISGDVYALTNGYYKDGIFDDPTITNATFYGDNLVPGNLDISGDLTFDGFASKIEAEADYIAIRPEAGTPVFLGDHGGVAGVSTLEGHFTNFVRTGSLLATNIYMEGGSLFASTNQFPAGADISFGRYPLTSLANGNNAAVPVGTNVFVEVSGPSGAFTINGINAANAQRDGKYLILLNQTGQDMTVAHQSGTDPTAGNRIITMTGADRSTTGNGAATFIYSGNASRWILISLDP